VTVGLVLSGGGARGNFQVGAARYLYERNVRPTVITGTSVGAINAVKLAEGEGAGNDETRGLRGLIRIWRDLQTTSDMWVEEDWYTKVKNLDLMKTITKAVSVVTPPFPNPLPFSDVIHVFRKLSDLGSTSAEVNKLIKDIKEILEGFKNSQSLYNLGPIYSKLNDQSKLDPAKVWHSGIKLRMSIVALESGELRYVTEKGHVLERDCVAYVQTVPPYAPECLPIAVKIKELEQQRVSLYSELELAAPRDKAGIIEKIREKNGEISYQSQLMTSCKITHPPQSVPLSIALSAGTLASASIPLAFSPIKIGNEHYVDGGVRELVPIQAAIQAGATEIYAVLASDNSLDQARGVLSKEPIVSFGKGSANLLDVANRAASDIMANEVGLNEVEPYTTNRSSNVNVMIIQPEHDIHDIMTIDPGLIDIRMAYGYMRADDTYQARQADPTNYRQLANQYSQDRNTDLIYRMRYEIWKLEYEATGYRFECDEDGRPKYPPQWIGHNLDAIRQVRDLKNRLSDLVHDRRRKGGYVPEEAQDWSNTWERHPWTPDRGLWLPNAPAAQGSVVRPGETLGVDQAIHSPNGLYSLVFQGDGNLVLYKITKTTVRVAQECRPIQDEINQLQNQLATLQAQLATASPREKEAITEQIQQLKAIIDLRQGELTACNATYPPEVRITRNAAWATGTAATAGACYLEHDGNLYIFDEGKQIVWFTNKGRNPNSHLAVQDDGNIVICRPDGGVVWSMKG